MGAELPDAGYAGPHSRAVGIPRSGQGLEKWPGGYEFYCVSGDALGEARASYCSGEGRQLGLPDLVDNELSVLYL